jgi:Flp pilus assembly CpaF family ATPase
MANHIKELLGHTLIMGRTGEAHTTLFKDVERMMAASLGRVFTIEDAKEFQLTEMEYNSLISNPPRTEGV